MSAMADEILLPAWDEPVHASQATFRTVLDALSRPGVLHTLPVAVSGPVPLEMATAALLLALADFDTPIWRDAQACAPAVAAWLRFHCGCPMTGMPDEAAFAVIAEPAALAIARFARGSSEYPDRSTTVLVQVPSLVAGPASTLSGPGIEHEAVLRVGGLPGDFERQWQHNAAGFPLGVDLVFCCGNRIVGLPRTTRMEQASCM